MDFIKATDSGLQIATRKEILDQLFIFARAAYGNDISLEDGTPFNAFLQMLADGLSTVSGATQSFSELFSSKEVSGKFLDFVAGQRGIIRRTVRNQRVIMTVTCTSEVVRPFSIGKNSIFLIDSLGRKWVNTSQLMIQQYKFLPSGEFDTVQNYQGTCEFGLLPLNGYDSRLLYANNYVDDTDANPDQFNRPLIVDAQSGDFIVKNFEFINSVNATPAVQESETDAQFRARYDEAVYAKSAATVEGLRSNLLELTDYVRIVENFTNSDAVSSGNPYGIAPHSIWCIVGGGSKGLNSSDSIYTVTQVVGIVDIGNGYKVGDTVYFDLQSKRFNLRIEVYNKEQNVASFTILNQEVLSSGGTFSDVGCFGGSGSGLRIEVYAGNFVSSKDSSDIAIAQTILNYKSLGCGVSVQNSVQGGTVEINGETFNTGNFSVDIPIDTMVAFVPFTRLVENKVSFNILLHTLPGVTDGVLRDSIRAQVLFELQSYVESLQPGDPITLVDTVNAVQKVLSKYEVGKFDFVSSIVSYSIGTAISIYQKAIWDESVENQIVRFDDEG